MSIALLVAALLAPAGEAGPQPPAGVSAPAPAGGRWILYQTGNGQDYFLDAGDAPDAGGIVRFRVRQVTRPPVPDNLPYHSVIAQFQVDCPKQTIAMVALTTFDAAGRVDRAQTIPPERIEKDQVYAGTENEAFYLRYCPARLRRPVGATPPPPVLTIVPPPIVYAPAPPPPPPPPSGNWPAVRAQPAVPLASLFTADDYPAQALRLDQEGTVRYRLTVDKRGRVAACAVTASSGSSILDSVTCRLVTKRARFTPARNAKGKRMADAVAGAISWRIPVDEPVEPATPPAPE